MNSLVAVVSVASVLVTVLLLRRSRRRGPKRLAAVTRREPALELDPSVDYEAWEESLTAGQMAQTRSLTAVNRARGMEPAEALRAAAALVHRSTAGEPGDRAQAARTIAELERAVREDPALRERVRRVEEREQAEVTAEVERTRRR